MKLFDLRLRGCFYTLGAVVESESADFDTLRTLIEFLQAPHDEYQEKSWKIDLPNTFSIEGDILGMSEEDKRNFLEKGESLGYWVCSASECTLTEQAIQVFTKMIQRDDQLSKQGFASCPCHGY